MGVRLALITVAIVAATASTASAGSPRVATEVQVPTAGVNFSNPASTAAFYASLRRAAHKACDSRMDRQLGAVMADGRCADEALDKVVQSMGQPTLMALHTHTTGQPAPATVMAAR